MRVEQELKIAEEARISAEQDAAAQRYAANVLQVNQWLDLFWTSALLFYPYKLFPVELGLLHSVAKDNFYSVC